MADNSLVLSFGLHYSVLYKYYSLPSDLLTYFAPVCKVRLDCKEIRLQHLSNSDKPPNRRVFLDLLMGPSSAETWSNALVVIWVGISIRPSSRDTQRDNLHA
jgi:hypothetical protein